MRHLHPEPPWIGAVVAARRRTWGTAGERRGASLVSMTTGCSATLLLSWLLAAPVAGEPRACTRADTEAAENVPCDAVACTTSDAQLVVLTRDRRLWLCDEGRAVASYPVALGRGGLGKRARGDNRTPLGSYTLGVPRPSSRFGIFIPVAYPTAEQRLQGYTGSAVGIHGPHRHSRRAGEANTWFDWTAGCIALGSDEEVQVVASWVRSRRPTLTVR